MSDDIGKHEAQLRVTAGGYQIGTLDLVVISKAEYDSLRYSADWYEALRDAGVDNWSGYDYAAEIIYGKDDDD